MTTTEKLGFCAALLFMFMLVPNVFAQSQQAATSEKLDSPNPCYEPADKPTDNPCEFGTKELEELEPSVPQRLLRSWQYQFQLLEQPAVLVATSNGMTSTIPNPNKWLQQHSIVLQLSEWFPRSTNLPMLVQTAYDSRKPFKALELTSELCGNHKTALECLASGGSWWGRLFSGATLTFSVAQRDEVQQGVVIPTLSAAEGWSWNGTLDFNPASLFITSTNWKNAASVLAQASDKSQRHIVLAKKEKDTSNEKTSKALTPKDPDYFCIVPTSEVFSNTKTLSSAKMASCVKNLTKPSLTSSLNHTHWADFAAVAIPTFQLRALSQFDFLKQGGVLVANPQLQRSLKNMTISWDLRRLIASTTDRVAVGALYDQALKESNASTQKVGESKSSKLCVLRSRSSTSYVSVSEDSTMNACRGLAVALGGVDQYAVACASERIVLVGASAGINQPPGESNKPANNCGWIGGGEVESATTQTAGQEEEFVAKRQ
jgi:hypothetical protein